MDATCGKFCGRFRKNKVFSASQISPCVDSHQLYESLNKIRSSEEKDCQSACPQNCAAVLEKIYVY